MPTWDKILDGTRKFTPEALLEKYISSLHKFTGRTVILYFSAFTLPKPPASTSFLSIVDQDMQGFMTCSNGVDKESLDLILHTPGGDYEATKRIISYLHSTYKHIRVFIPHMAMSGGTLIACAADEIYMGPYSSLGPTDPQVFVGNKYVPAGAIIKEFYKAFEETAEDPRKVILWRERLNLIPPGLINSLETMLKNSKEYLKEILLKRNLKDKDKHFVEKIAQILNEHSYHSSHGRGIDLNTAEEIGLNVKDLSQNKELEDKVLSIYHAASIALSSASAYKIIINHLKRKFVMHNLLPANNPNNI